MTEYRELVRILELKHNNQGDLLLFHNGSDYLTYDNKQIVFIDGFNHLGDKQTTYIEFHPLNEQKQSCSHLLVDDSIHLYLKNKVYNLFNKILRIKDGTNAKLTHEFDKDQIDLLPNPTIITQHKFNYLFTIPFAKNIITFSIDFNSTSNCAIVDFKYPLYDELCTLNNNTLFGLYLEDFEILLFKKIYEEYIINMINNLFHKDIEVPQNSNLYPQYYTLLKIKVILQEAFWKEYDINERPNIKRNLIKYNEMLDNLNQFTYMLPSISKEQQELDFESYKNEMERRKESESNWLKLKDTKMQEIVKKEQTEIIINSDKKIETFMQHIAETAYKKYIRQTENFLTDQRVNDYIQNYNQFKNNQEWAELFHWQNLVLNILNGNGTSL
ncbi:hypothetical protein NG754_11135, partial [Aliarcobacter cryaerophilus]|uniref:hypothetical protein n=1 Tax=Aliarcobacter cryaerophilus TaxID=28198 RepID=UPI003DA1F2AA